MKKLDEIVSTIDHKIDQAVKPINYYVQKYFSFFSIAILTTFVTVFVVRTFYNKPTFLMSIIRDDLTLINRALHKIDKTCIIIDIRHENAVIDFLTVEKFVSSSVGCLNLGYPEKWRGPYLSRNPSLQGKQYQLIKARDGLFLLPGIGVKLPNGKIIGKDIQITAQSNIAEMIKPGKDLSYKGEALALKVDFKVGSWEGREVTNERIERINKMWEDFNTAMSYTQNKKEKTTA